MPQPQTILETFHRFCWIHVFQCFVSLLSFFRDYKWFSLLILTDLICYSPEHSFPQASHATICGVPILYILSKSKTLLKNFTRFGKFSDINSLNKLSASFILFLFSSATQLICRLFLFMVCHNSHRLSSSFLILFFVFSWVSSKVLSSTS